jgi:uncharacterized protein (DUF58 family)
MTALSDIFSFKKKNTQDKRQSALIPTLEQLTAMRRYVPYVADRKHDTTSDQSGSLKSAFKGRGMEFEEIRAYNYGDDVRDIDWRVTARKNQPYTKLYAEERDREIWVWLDLSATMRFGTKAELKSVTAAKTAALIGWLALSKKDRFGLAVFDGRHTSFFKADRSEVHLLGLFKQIEKIAARTESDVSDGVSAVSSLHELAQRLSRRVPLFAVGTFNAQDEAFQKTVSALAHKHDLSLIGIYDTIEYDAPPRGFYPAQYNGIKRLLVSNGEAFERLYTAHFAQKRADLQSFCSRHGCRFQAVRTDRPVYRQFKSL